MKGPFIWYESFRNVSFVFSQFHAFDRLTYRRTDGHTDGRTDISVMANTGHS